MKTSCNLAVLALVVLGTPLLLLAEPPAERKSGKVLILPNQRALEGDIERLGERFRVRRSTGGEMWIPVDKTLYLCSDWSDAFAFMATQANLIDPDERIRLAKWCQSNGLYDLARKEIEVALEMRPKDAAALQFKTFLEQTSNSSGRRTAEPTASPVCVAPASLDVGVKSLAMFASRIQPILANTCFSCHQADRNTRFKLFRVTEASYRHALENNLVSALAQIDTDNPELSPLLCKAATNHGGGGKAPLNGRDSIPFQTLQAWVQQVIDTNPQLRAQRTTAARARDIPHLTQSVSREPATPRELAPPTTQQVSSKEGLFKLAAATAAEKPLAPPPSPQGNGPPRGLPTVPATPLTQQAAAPTTQATTAPPSGFAIRDRESPAPNVPSAGSSPLSNDPYDAAAFNKRAHPQQP